MFTLMGATVIVAGALPMEDSLIARRGACPARLTSSALLAVNCHSVDGPLRSMNPPEKYFEIGTPIWLRRCWA